MTSKEKKEWLKRENSNRFDIELRYEGISLFELDGKIENDTSRIEFIKELFAILKKYKLTDMELNDFISIEYQDIETLNHLGVITTINFSIE